jgi:DNA-binding transcriptional regulator LsrR (DeoR family)
MTNLPAHNSKAADDERFQVKIAWLYYVEGLTQAEVAAQLDVTRLRVNRALAKAHRRGVIRIQINSVFSPCMNLESEFRKKYNLQDVSIVPKPADDDHVQSVVGAELGHYLSVLLNKPEIRLFGIGWGSALHHATRYITPSERKDLEIVSIMGCLPQGSDINGFEITTRLAAHFSAKRTFFTAPLYASSESSRDTIMRQPVFEQVLKKSRSADATVIGVGAASKLSMVVRDGLPEDVALSTLLKAGAVGDMMGHFINKHGEFIDHPINRRVIGINPLELRKMPNVILTSGGKHKVPVISAALKMGVVKVLITDQRTAESILLYDAKKR